jgi:hypothetical protein
LDLSISAFDKTQNHKLLFTIRSDVFFPQNQIVRMTEILSPFNCKQHLSPWSIVILFADGSVHFIDTRTGICYLTGPPNTFVLPFNVAIFQPLMKSCKRYILVILDEELASANKEEKEEDLFELGGNFDATSKIQILDTWSLDVVDIALEKEMKFQFIQRMGDVLSILTKRDNLLMINISMLNTNSHMKISEDLKMNSLVEQIKNIFQYCRTNIMLSEIFGFIQEVLTKLQKDLKLNR